jgi:hypothetical protein
MDTSGFFIRVHVGNKYCWSMLFTMIRKMGMKKFAIAGFLSMSVLASGLSAASPFEDIDSSHWAYPKIKYLYDHGIIRGTGTGRFDGNERISRYEAAALVYQSLQQVSRTQAAGGTIDADIMDTINSLMTELTDEMQVIEVRIEENSDSIAMLRNHLASMHGKPTQGVSIPMGQGRLKFMGQTMASLVMGGDNSGYRNAFASNNTTALGAGASPTEGATEFVSDYLALAMAADIGPKTSFFARANVYTGGEAGAFAPGAFGDTGLKFNDYMYLHVRDLWSDWDFTLGRMGLPYGHEVAGAFRTNPYFVSNSLVDALYGNRLITGAYFSTESDDGNWNWGVGIHNGDQANPQGGYTHLSPAGAFMAPGAVVGAPAFTNWPVGGFDTSLLNAINNNEDDAFGFLLHVGSRSAEGDFKWDLNYFSNGGDSTVNAAGTAVAGYGAMSYINFGADYRVNHDWAMMAEYVQGNVEVLNLARAGVTGAIVEDDFTTWYFQLVYNLDHKSTVAFRLSDHSYNATGTTNLDDETNEMALSYTRKVSDNGTLILEWADADWDRLAGATKATACPTGTACNDDYDTVRASYRVDF